jgi:hypothetical protein
MVFLIMNTWSSKHVEDKNNWIKTLILKSVHCICLHHVTVMDFCSLNILQPTGYVMHHQFNIQQLYALSTLYLCVLYLSENKQRLVPLTA